MAKKKISLDDVNNVISSNLRLEDVEKFYSNKAPKVMHKVIDPQKLSKYIVIFLVALTLFGAGFIVYKLVTDDELNKTDSELIEA